MGGSKVVKIENMDDTKLEAVDEYGVKKEYMVLFTYDDEASDSTWIGYTDDVSKPDIQVYVSKINPLVDDELQDLTPEEQKLADHLIKEISRNFKNN